MIRGFFTFDMCIPLPRASEHTDHGLVQNVLAAVSGLVFGFIVGVENWFFHYTRLRMVLATFIRWSAIRSVSEDISRY